MLHGDPSFGNKVHEYMELTTIFGMVATVIGMGATAVLAPLALMQYRRDLKEKARQRMLDNASRFLELYKSLYAEGGFLATHIFPLGEGQEWRRNVNDPAQEQAFERALAEIDKIALLEMNGAVPEAAMVYMFGWMAQKIYPQLCPKERGNAFWGAAVQFLERMDSGAKDFLAMSPADRKRFLGAAFEAP